MIPRLREHDLQSWPPRLVWILALAAALSCGVTSAAITLDAGFDQGSLDVDHSSVAGDVVTLVGRDNFNPGRWKWLYFAASGVADRQLTFRIEDDFIFGGDGLVKHQMVYSYDRRNWKFFDDNTWVPKQGLFTFSNRHPFTQDRVYVAYGLPYPYSRIAGRMKRLAASSWIRPTATGGASFVIGQSPGGVDDLGRAIAPRNIYAFRVSDFGSTAVKKKVVLVGGVHANETLGNYALEGLVDYLVGGMPEAATLRERAEFFVYPMVNPDGRFAGYNRSTVEQVSLDPNRHWAPPRYGGLDDLRIVAEAMISDAAKIDYLIDFQSDTVGKSGHYAYVLPKWQSHPLWVNLRRLEPTVRAIDARLANDTTAKFGRDELEAQFSITFETQFIAGENVDRFHQLGRNWGRAMFNTITVSGDADRHRPRSRRE